MLRIKQQEKVNDEANSLQPLGPSTRLVQITRAHTYGFGGETVGSPRPLLRKKAKSSLDSDDFLLSDPQVSNINTLSYVGNLFKVLRKTLNPLLFVPDAEHKHIHKLRRIRTAHNDQYPEDGNPVVFALRSQTTGLKLPLYRWAHPRHWSNQMYQAKPADTCYRRERCIVSLNWNPINWLKVKGIVFYCHGMFSHSRFELLRPVDLPRENAYLTRDLDAQEVAVLGERIKSGSGIHTYEGSLLESIINHDFVVYAPDHQAHGLAEGWRGRQANVRNIAHIVTDFIQWVEVMIREREISPGTPIFLMGCSTGADLLIRAIEIASKQERFAFDRKGAPTLKAGVPVIRGTVLVAPPLSIYKVVEELENAKMKQKCCGPRLTIERKIPALLMQTPHNYVATMYKVDILCMGDPIPKKTGLGLLQLIKDVLESAGEFSAKTSVLLMQSNNDPLTDTESSEYFMRNLPCEDKEVRFTQKARHYLFADPGFLVTAAIVLEWMEARC